MAARRYEISLRELKKYFSSERSERGKYFSTLYKYLLYKYYSEIVSTLTKAPLQRRESLCYHNNGDLTYEDNMLFSRVKI